MMFSSTLLRHYLMLQTLFVVQLPGHASAEKTVEIRANELLQQIESGNSPAILDTRSGFEYKRGHIPDARHFPFWLSYLRADDLELPKDKPIVVYCAHGPRAVFAKGALEKSGFSNIKLLKGNMSGWKKAGLPVE